MDYQKAAAVEELTRAQTEIMQLHEDKVLLEGKVSRLAGTIRSFGHDPTDFLSAVSAGYGRSRNVDSPTLATSINAISLSPQHQSTTMHGERGATGAVSTGGARSVATGGLTATSRSHTLQQLAPEAVKRTQSHQSGMKRGAQHAASQVVSLPGGISIAELLSNSTTKDSLPQHVDGALSHDSSEAPDPKEYALPSFTQENQHQCHMLTLVLVCRVRYSSV